jgi:hypothetical protein
MCFLDVYALGGGGRYAAILLTFKPEVLIIKTKHE